MSHDHSLHEFLIALPLTAVQIAIAWTLVGWARRRFPLAVNIPLGIAVAFIGLFELVTVVMDTISFDWHNIAFLAPHFAWMKTVTYVWMFPCVPAYFAFLLYRRFLRKSPESVNPGRRQLIHAAGALAITAPFALEAFGAFVGRLNFQVRETDLRIKDLHPDLENLRILQLSDVHLSQYLSVNEFARVIDASNELRPNIALMTGDLISSWGDPMDACLAQLRRVRSDTEMLGCLGNHERYTETEEYATRKGAAMGITFLRKESRQLRFGRATINFGGVDYLPFENRGHYLTGVGQLRKPDALNILLSHNPDVFPEAAAQGWDVTLAGHTHGGQVTVEILDQTLNFARVFTRYVSGLYRRNDSLCYVTRGIGTIGIPARLGAMPEITLLRLRKA